MTFINAYQRDIILIISLELKTAIYKLTLDVSGKEHDEHIIKLRRKISFISLNIQSGLKDLKEVDLIYLLDDLSIYCSELQKQLLECKESGVFTQESIEPMLEQSEVIKSFVVEQMSKNSKTEYYLQLCRKFW